MKERLGYLGVRYVNERSVRAFLIILTIVVLALGGGAPHGHGG